MSSLPCGGQDAGAEVAGGELAQLAGEDGDAERRESGRVRSAIRSVSSRERTVRSRRSTAAGAARGVDDDEVAVGLQDGRHLGEDLFQGTPVEVLQDAGSVRSSCGGSARSALVTAMAVGTRSSPSHAGRSAGVTPPHRNDFIA
ncbi:hypothetical protein SGLAM104S_03267 [Streptomyces glaucescens]